MTEEIPVEPAADAFASPAEDVFPPVASYEPPPEVDSFTAIAPGAAETQIASWSPPESGQDQFPTPGAQEPEATTEDVPGWDAPAENVEEPAPDEGDLGEVAVFGNSSTPAGPLSYGIVIEGIELAETYGQLRDAITDSRFAWDADKVMKSIKSGRLELKGMNATKAALLVHRLKYLPVEISWSQEIYAASSEADPS